MQNTRSSRGRGAHSTHEVTARGLGYFSIALGLAEIFGARTLCRATGLDGHERLIRAYGFREVMTGVAILASHDPTPWIWGRVGGDAVDMATLAAGVRNGNGDQRMGAGVALAVVAGVTALDIATAVGLTSEKQLSHVPVENYSDRSGFPGGAETARGAARDFEVPRDMRIPDALRPYGT
jgi:hypothetical protein